MGTIWSNYKFFHDEVEARDRAALLQKMAESSDAARVVKLKHGGYMVQIHRKWERAFQR